MSQRFDDLTRVLGRPRSRREALKMALGAVAGVVAAAGAGAATVGNRPAAADGVTCPAPGGGEFTCVGGMCCGVYCGWAGGVCCGDCPPCPPGQKCSSVGCFCVDACDGIDTNTDPNNCGACGNACPAGQSCCNGSCCDGTCLNGTCCPSSQSICSTASGDTCCAAGTTCAPQGDPSGTVPAGSSWTCCPPDRVVPLSSGNTCCPEGYTSLGGKLVVPAGGGGGLCCANAQVCGSGASITCCGPDQTCCNGTCVSIQSDSNNCGACGHTCPAGRVCQSGSCVCPNGGTNCGSTCCASGQCCNSATGTCGTPCGGTCCTGTCQVSGKGKNVKYTCKSH